MKKKLLLAPLMAALVTCVVLLSGCGGPSVEELITNDLTSQFDEIKNGGDDFLSGLEKASGEPNKNKVAKLPRAKAQEIAQSKMQDLNAADLEAATRMIEGTARSMGIEIVD